MTLGRIIALAATASLACAHAAAPSLAPTRYAAVDDARLLQAAEDPDDWLTYGGTYLEERFSRLDEINVDNVSRLRPAWYFEVDTTRGQEATPIVVDGVMYVTTAWSKVYALDARTGRELWFYDPNVPGTAGPKPCCDVVNRGAAVYRGSVYFGTIDGRLIALDARTGRERWSVLTVDPKQMYSITGAPRVARGKVFIGNGGGEFGGRGYLSAYDAGTGALVWRFYTVPADPSRRDGAASDDALEKIARPTWEGPWPAYKGGGQVWNAILYDPELAQVYLATGNGFPMNRNFRSAGRGDNLFIASIVAVDADTGRYVWHYQETPGESWDYDSVQDMVLTTLSVAGSAHQVLLHAPKNGFFYVLDRRTGKLLSVAPYVPGINWATGVDVGTGRPDVLPQAYYANAPFTAHPGEGGAHGWQPMAYSPRTGLVYFPAAESSTYYLPTPTYEFIAGLDNPGIVHGAQPSAGASASPAHGAAASFGRSYLLAWDPIRQQAAWHIDVRAGGGVLVTAGNLVFEGHARGSAMMGTLTAYRADDGRPLWSFDTPNAIMPGPVSYRVAGEQYIAVMSGAGGANIIFGTDPVREREVGRVLAFKLGGSAVLPADPAVASAPIQTQQSWPADVIAEGKERYGRVCGRCHGLNMHSANIVPDLRRSAALVDRDAWQAIVIAGALTDHGMVGWSDVISPSQAESIRAYVAHEARAAAQAAAHASNEGQAK